jgi:hypothetical protein
MNSNLLHRKISGLLGIISLLAVSVAAAGDATRKDWCNKPGHQRLDCSCYSSELINLSGKVRNSIDAVRESLEEWGTLGLSGVLLAPPQGSFGIDINTREFQEGSEKKKYNFSHWFAEASKAEGSVQFSERIFNTFAASGSLQLAPEQAAIAQSILEKQKIDTDLYQQQLERSRVQRAAELDDFQLNRTNAIHGRQVAIDAAQAAADRAETARVEAELVRNQTASRRAAARREMDTAQRNLDAIPATPANAVSRTQLLSNLQEKQAAFDRVDVEFRTGDDNLRSRIADEKSARDALADAKAAKISAGVLPGAEVTTSTTSPTLDMKTGFAFAQEAKPGETLTQARAYAASVPVIKDPPPPPGLSESDLPTTLGSAAGIESAFPARARLIDAASNQVIARIFDFLGDPSAALQFEDKPILMAAGTVAVNPGWRTLQDYDGQIDVAARYEWKVARRVTCERISKFKNFEDVLFNSDEIKIADFFAKNGRWPEAANYHYTGQTKDLESFGKPLAAAVSPLMERQNIDEASSRARQDEIALFLSASLAKSGQKAAGEVFNKYMRLRRLDVKTLSSLPVINSYGLGGSHFGFNVTSRLQATGDLNRPKPAQILEKQNFPVLIIFGLSGDNLRPRLVRHEGRAEIWEPRIILEQTHRWSRQKKRGVFHQGLRSVVLPGFPGRPIENPVEDYRLLNRLSDSWERYTLYLRANKSYASSEPVNYFTEAAREDQSFLKSAYFFATTALDIPVDYLTGPLPEPTADSTRTAITEVLPRALTPRTIGNGTNPHTYEAEVIVLGRNLNVVDATKIGTGQRTTMITRIPLPPGIRASQAIALKLTFAERPVDAIQVSLPVGEPKDGFQPVVYSPMITFQY